MANANFEMLGEIEGRKHTSLDYRRFMAAAFKAGEDRGLSDTALSDFVGGFLLAYRAAAEAAAEAAK
jgi:hypothetical protein